ncbi:MAG: NAD(P)-dependent oxidoreductase, partial [Candidatus Thorarchaeota archaeon]
FGMTILYTSRSDTEAKRMAERETGAKRVDLDTLLRSSDFVSIHVSLTDETRHLIDRSKLALMKPTAFIINTARGGVIDEKALIKALDEGKIAGAGLDVFETEPPDDWILAKHPKVVATPHIASSTVEAQARVGELTAEKVIKELT